MKIKLFLALILQCLWFNSWASEFPLMFNTPGGKSTDTYAIVAVGGSGEDRHMWGGAETYQFLTKFMGVPKNNIKVCVQDGSTSHDFDGDNVNDVNYAASISGIESAFNALSSRLNTNSKFIFFIMDHGSPDYVSLFTNSLHSQKLASLLNEKIPCKNVNVWIHACYSGSFIDDLKGHDRHLNIITATSADRSALSMDGKGSFLFDPFYAALAGHYKIKVNDYSDIANDNEADYNNDGQISYEEAFVFAKDHDWTSLPYSKVKYPNENYNEIPRYWSSDTDYRFCRNEDWGVRTIGYVNSTKKEEAMYLITANGTLGANANVTLSSGKTIRFGKGFKTQKGAHLLAQLFDCEAEKRQNPAELRKTYLTEEEEIAEEVTEESVASIEVAPNPSNGIFTVTLGEAETDITLMDIQGRVLKSYNHVSGNFEIDITDAPNGMYLMVLASDSFKVTRKIVKY